MEMTLPTNMTLTLEEFNKIAASYTTQAHQASLTDPPAFEIVRERAIPAAPPLPSSTAARTIRRDRSTPITPLSPASVAPTSLATTIFSMDDLAVDSVMPGIYLTKNFMAWNEGSLRAHGFTHIIIIDKHIQQLYYPAAVFKMFATPSPDTHAYDSVSAFDHYAPPTLSFGKEFEALDLNFGTKSYLTTVLPNCYRAVKFIDKALLAGGTILVIDCNGGEQKCVTVVVAYLMYKHNISFSHAFARLKAVYKQADLDRFYMSQLYEYEPILQVQRAQSRGHSCSRELIAAVLKRKKLMDEDEESAPLVRPCAANEFFAGLNPLSQFNTHSDHNGASLCTSLLNATAAAGTGNDNFTQSMGVVDAAGQQRLTTAHRQTHHQKMNTAVTMSATTPVINWEDCAME